MNKTLLLLCGLAISLQTVQAAQTVQAVKSVRKAKACYFKENCDILNKITTQYIQNIQDLMDASDELQQVLEAQGIKNSELFSMKTMLYDHFQVKKERLIKSNNFLSVIITQAKSEKTLISHPKSLAIVIDTIASSQLLLGMLAEILKQARNINTLLLTLLPKKTEKPSQELPLHHQSEEFVNHDDEELKNILWNHKHYCIGSPTPENNESYLDFSPPSSEYISAKIKDTSLSSTISAIKKK